MCVYGLRVGQYQGAMDSLAQSALRCGRPPTEQYGHSEVNIYRTVQVSRMQELL